MRAVAVQIDKELATGKTARYPVRPMHRQRGLAHPRGADQCRYRHVRRGDHLVQPRQLGGSAGESPDGRRQLPGNRTCDRLCRWAVESRVRAQHLLVQCTQGGARFDPQILVQQTVYILVGSQRLGLPTGLVQREDPLTPEPLPELVPGGQHGELRRHRELSATAVPGAGKR
nr:hypothetical protein [Nonomuraea basaltis]